MRSKSATTPPISSFGPLQPITVPSHYEFLLSTQIMASSPLLQPPGYVRGLIIEDRWRYSSLCAQIRRSKFSYQFFTTVVRRSEWRSFQDRFAREPFTVSGTVGFMPISA